MLTTGYQLAAARALIGMDQVELAAKVGLSANTIRNMEASKANPIAGRSQNVGAVQRALEAAGVEFLNHGQPGVRLQPAAGELLALRSRNARLRAKVEEVAQAAASDVRQLVDRITNEAPVDPITGHDELEAVHSNLRRRAAALIEANPSCAQDFKGLL